MEEKSKYRWEHGPRVVAIGGGTGLSTMLRGLKSRTKNLTAIVTVADDGGGSGVLRQDLGMPPPGDIRHCMEALANAEPIMQQLLAYRFPVGSGRLTGQSFGNLILAALNGVAGSFEEAVAQMSQVLAISGRVLPVTSADVKLEATFENGTAVVGESLIADFKKAQDCRISKVRLLPERPAATPAALEAIRKANLIVLGPGSLYTSVIPNLLVEGVAQAICESDALKIYIGNIMTQDGETEGMTLSDHVSALLEHSGPGLIDLCVANSAPVDPTLIQRYKAEDADPIAVDKERIEALGVEVVERPMISSASRYARHSPERLGEVTMELYEERADTKVF
ncbi:MAG: YvcK family protein [Oscillospiraceae bacterium]|nr:YvcK family protein [Oscillospiraceae bacterium]